MFIRGTYMSENNDNMKLITEDQIKEITPEQSVQDIDLAPESHPSSPAKVSKRKNKACNVPLKKTTIGGQALIEGVMMVGPSRTAMAVRKGDGTIHVEEIKQSERTTYFEKVPFVRGCIRFYKMLVTGTGALMRAADISEEGKPEANKDGQKKSRLDEFAERHFNLMMTISAIIGICLSVGLFILAPRLIIEIVTKFIPDHIREITWVPISLNIAEGILRLIIFLLYLVFASSLKDIKRVWRYHGAEHKTIACYEAGLPLTVENVLKQTRFHPRCGTCAFQNELSLADAEELKKNGCWCCCEVSNMGCQPDAIHFFQESGILFAPGKAVNAGGVATSGLEMTQNASHISWSAEEVDAKLHYIMKSIHEQCVRYGTKPDGSVDYVKGANIAGFMKVAHAMLEKGVI